jgi:hypothetical protein
MTGFVRLSSARSRRPAIQVDPHVWVVIAFSLFAVLPLASPDYFFEAHDAPHSIFFLTEFDAALRDGVWYPGWATDQALGYGYPTFVLYPPLAFYAAEVFHLLGATKVVAVKWTWALATIGAGLAMYSYGRHVLGRRQGLLAAVVYVYIPYHLVDIYVRAALAEYCAFVWMPLVLLAFHRLVEKISAARLALAGLAYAALWMTHNVTGLAFTPLLVGYVLFRLLVEPRGASGPADREKDAADRSAAGDALWRDRMTRAAASLGAGLLGLGIAGALLLPNLLERSAISQEQWVRASYDYALHFVYPFQFLSSFWGYGAAGPGPVDGMSFQLGFVPIVLASLATVSALCRRSREHLLIAFFAASTLVLVLSILPISVHLWDVLPIASLVQFPWRLMALTSVTMAILCGLSVSGAGELGAETTSRVLSPQVLILALVAALASFPFTLPEYTPVPPTAEGPLLSLEFELEYSDMVGITAWSEELPSTSPLVPQYLAGSSALTTADALAPGATLEMVRAGGASDEMWVRSPAGTELRFYTYYFPGWRVYVDGERLPDMSLRPAPPYGLLAVDIPPGEHHVLLRWGDTPVRAAGKGLTLACLALSVILLWPWRRGATIRWPNCAAG